MANLSFLKKPKAASPVESEVRKAIGENHADDIKIEAIRTPEIPHEASNDTADRITGDRKLSRLIEDDFPFDESQLAAVEGMIESQYGCMTGAAGTGKTTTTKKLVDELLEGVSNCAIGQVDMRRYWAKETDDRMQDSHYATSDPDDDYDYDKSQPIIPSIAMVSFTGRATQQIKRNFPRDWHGNIMTIHRLLGFIPEMYQDYDPEFESDDGTKGGYRNKMRFVPTYTADCLLPWDIIIIDEAGMLGLDLWHQLWAACKKGCRIYMIGDINQLPPVHGKSIFGFAMSKWPAWELTKVHRQQGVNNPIVDNAWRIIHGQLPQSEGKFQMIPLKGDAQRASRQVRATAPKLMEMGIYEPNRDTIITPINGEDGSRGFALGQKPLNQEFALIFNPTDKNPRFIIDGGRERKMFAIGDKVMATRNDYEAGITNGMTGIITSIEENGGYTGEKERFGTVEDVNAWMRDVGDREVEEDLMRIEDLDEKFMQIDEGNKNKKEKRDRGPSSHVVTVFFGTAEHGFEIPFGSLAEVGSLMTAYVVTCHKMQGGESPVVIIILHDAHKAMLYREWLYTAVTRASEKCILMYSETALRATLNKQSIKGSTLQEKVRSFIAATDSTGNLRIGTDIRLPESNSTSLTILDQKEKSVVTPSRLATDAEKRGGVASLIRKQREKQTLIQNITINIVGASRNESEANQTVDGGDITPEKTALADQSSHAVDGTGDSDTRALPSPERLGLTDDSGPRYVPQWGAVYAAVELSHAVVMSNRLLTYDPPKPKVASGLAFLMKKKENK